MKRTIVIDTSYSTRAILIKLPLYWFAESKYEVLDADVMAQYFNTSGWYEALPADYFISHIAPLPGTAQIGVVIFSKQFDAIDEYASLPEFTFVKTLSGDGEKVELKKLEEK